MVKSEYTNPDETTGITTEAARVYDEFFVPALFAEWASIVTDTANINEGDKVLDVACGTGVLARYIKTKKKVDVTGLDLNESMLLVAAEKNKEIEWNLGTASSLPYTDETFDSVVCQFGLMFFDDKEKSLQEMMRVLKNEKKMVLTVWDEIENSPGYALLVKLLEHRFGTKIADMLRFPFSLGNIQSIKKLFADSLPYEVKIKTHTGIARFPSVRAWLYTDIRGWIFSQLIDDSQLESFIASAENELEQFTISNGEVHFEMPGHIISTRRQ